MKIATWNVNSVRTRAGLVVDFLEREQPDLLLLQEIKCEAHQFPADVFEAAGYRAAIVGQKSYNGVAVLSREAVEIRERCLPGEAEGAASRYIEVALRDLIVGNLYLPNGNSGGDDGFRAKLDWMGRLHAHAAGLLEADRDFMLAGDYNVCPTDADYATGALSATDALVRPESRAAFRALIWLGLTDALRALHPTETLYTFWDYQAGAWQRDRGLRIDHALLSPRVSERLESVVVAKSERDKTQPSDHVPVVVVVQG
jgi:exodeoxyribonuclease-3